jgi:hypothetical protein
MSPFFYFYYYYFVPMYFQAVQAVLEMLVTLFLPTHENAEEF